MAIPNSVIEDIVRDCCQRLERNELTYLELINHQDSAPLRMTLSNDEAEMKKSVDDLALARICDGLRNNTSLVTLDSSLGISPNRIAPPVMSNAVVPALVDFLLSNVGTLRNLWVFNAGLNDQQAIVLSRALEGRPLLPTTLGFMDNRIGDDGACAILNSVESILVSMESFNGNFLGRTLSLDINQIGVAGARKLASVLEQDYKHLHHVYFNGNPIGEGSAALARSMEANMNIVELTFDGSVEEKARVSLFCALNKAGRKLLKEENVHAGLWSYMLAKVGRKTPDEFGPDMVYYFVRENTKMLFNFLPTGTDAQLIRNVKARLDDPDFFRQLSRMVNRKRSASEAGMGETDGGF